MPRSARAACLLVFAGLACTSCRDAFKDRSNAAVQDGESMTHLEMYIIDTSMALDHAVFSELAADTSVLLPETVLNGAAKRIDRVALASRLDRDGFPEGGPRLKAALAAFDRTERSSMAGDDQAFVLYENGVYRYGAHVDLGFPEQPVGEQTLLDGKFHWIASVTNQSKDEGYALLKVEPDMSACLFAGNSETNGFVAYWVPVDKVATCAQSQPLAEGFLQKARMLQVIRTEPHTAGSDFDATDIPASTRVEWGPKLRQMIGVKCGGQWCQIVPDGTKAADLEPMPTMSESEPKDKRRNWRMKGRSDYQMLADRDNNGNLVPSGILARVRPGLQKDMENPGKQFATVAEVTFEFDVSLTPTPPKFPEKYLKQGFSFAGINLVKFCDDTYKKCTGADQPVLDKCTNGRTIWGKVFSGNGSVTPAFAVCEHLPQNGTKAPNLWITRWNWKPSDEGLWVRCLNGCCTPK